MASFYEMDAKARSSALWACVSDADLFSTVVLHEYRSAFQNPSHTVSYLRNLADGRVQAEGTIVVYIRTARSGAAERELESFLSAGVLLHVSARVLDDRC